MRNHASPHKQVQRIIIESSETCLAHSNQSQCTLLFKKPSSKPSTKSFLIFGHGLVLTVS